MKLKNAKHIYSFFIVVLYFVLGILLLLKNLMWQEVPGLSMALFGVVVMAYSFFRGYRAYKAYKTQEEESDETE
jgi:uncharacterized membrane protein